MTKLEEELSRINIISFWFMILAVAFHVVGFYNPTFRNIGWGINALQIILLFYNSRISLLIDKEMEN